MSAASLQSQTVCLSDSGWDLELESIFFSLFHHESVLVAVRSNNRIGEYNTHTHTHIHTSAEERSGRYITSMVIEEQMEVADTRHLVL